MGGLSVRWVTVAALGLLVGEVVGGEGPQAGQSLQVSGIHPHLAVFNEVGGECGIGAVVPWAGKLWLMTYPPHMRRGSSDKLYEIDSEMKQTIRPESVGGTHANRMIHRESNQLIMGPYVIAADGTVRVLDVKKALVGRMTATARHLSDPANKVYFFDMEGPIYEADVRTLEVRKLFEKPVPGWHGKGGYTSQGRLVVANNGESAALGDLDKTKIECDLKASGPEDAGVLAEWDGKEWRVVERRQFTDVTGPGGIPGAPKDDSPLWAMGWDKRSVILKLLDGGKWHTFRVPKASHCFDPKHGWYTEWPRIREVGNNQLLMVMHGMMYDFPSTFSAANTAGLKPVCSHLRYVTDFCNWNGRLVVSSDDTSIMKNPMAGLSQSNVWFGEYAALKTWGPRAGWGGVWLGDKVKAGEASASFLVNGFDRRCLHLAVGGARGGPASETGVAVHRCTGSFPLTQLPAELAGLTCVSIARGDFHKAAPGYGFSVKQDVLVYLAVDDRPKAELGEGWEKTDLKTAWGDRTDTVYKKSFKAGRIEIPGHPAEHKPGDYGVPHLCFVKPAGGGGRLEIGELPGNLGARVSEATATEAPQTAPAGGAGGEVTFTLEADANGDGKWAEYKKVTVGASGYQFHIFPADLAAQWVRLKTDRDTTATAYFHFSAAGHDAKAGEALFASLADAADAQVSAALIRPAGHNRNLQVLMNGRYCEVNEKLNFTRPETSRAEEVKKVCKVEPEFEVDAASASMRFKGTRYRFPKGAAQYDKPFAAGWPRCIREVESERYLVNMHGTFYEMPRDDGLPLIKPVCSHSKQISDFCTWRGLLVMSGTRQGAKPDGHCFAGEGLELWFGGVDDLWRLGKPVGKGGPWLQTEVRAGEASDPYLMTGYDKKSVQLSHDAAGEVEFDVEVDVTHHGWHTYQTLKVAAGQTVTHAFPEGYGAHWVRLKANKDCKATAAFVYE